MSYFNLKNSLVIDAITCSILFLACVFATAPVAPLLGLPTGLVAGCRRRR